MNYWKQIADMLGVDMGEEFEIEGYPAPAYNPYKITENGFIDCDGDITCSEACDLLTGRCKIKKKPWVPKHRELCFLVYDTCSVLAHSFKEDSPRDMALLKCGWIFRTEKEAEENQERILAEYEQVRRGEY